MKEAYTYAVEVGCRRRGLKVVAARNGAATAVTLDELIVALPLGKIGGGDSAEGEGDDG